MLKLEAASYRYAGAWLDSLHSVSIDLPAGSLSGLVGATEAGKSTLCLVLAGLAPRAIGGDLRGSLTVDGEDVAGWPLHQLGEVVVMGLQDPGGQLSMVAETVYEEVALGPVNLGCSRTKILERTEVALERLDLAGLAARDPRHLSGGQQQLVVLAGLLAMQPRYLILDEPLAHLDARSIDLLMAALGDVAAAGTAVLIAEQRTDILAAHCSSIAVMASGHIVDLGDPAALLSQPAVRALGVPEPAEQRLHRLLAEAR